MLRPSRRISVVVVSLSLVAGSLASAVSAAAEPTDAERADRAVGYIASQQQDNGAIPAFSPIGSTADAVLAFVAARTGRPSMRRALRYLERQVGQGDVDTIGLQAKVALAFEAAGRSPRDVAGVNLVRELRTAYENGLEPMAFDTALAVLAIEGAGASAPTAATDFLVEEQCPDGGWPFDAFDEAVEDEHCQNVADPDSDFFLSDTNSTALAIMALAEAGVDAGRNPFRFLREIRDDEHRGWGFSWGVETTDVNSTSLVLGAYRAAGRQIPAAGERALRDLQYSRCGAFAFTFANGGRTDPDVGATIGAVPGLRPLALPFSRDVSGPAPDTRSCRKQ
jgi:hypothetical protein